MIFWLKWVKKEGLKGKECFPPPAPAEVSELFQGPTHRKFSHGTWMSWERRETAALCTYALSWSNSFLRASHLPSDHMAGPWRSHAWLSREICQSRVSQRVTLTKILGRMTGVCVHACACACVCMCVCTHMCACVCEHVCACVCCVCVRSIQKVASHFQSHWKAFYVSLILWKYSFISIQY